MELSTRSLATALTEFGHGVTVLTQHCEGQPAVQFEAGVAVHRAIQPLRVGPLWGITYRQQIAAWMRGNANAWDFCICRGIYLHCSPAAMIAHLQAKPIMNILAASGPFGDIAQCRASRFGKSALVRGLAADGQFSMSAAITQELRAGGVDAEKIYPFRNFVDLDRFSPAVETISEPIVAFVGRLDVQKNIPLLLEAFDRVRSSIPNTKLLIVGSGPEESRLKDRASVLPSSSAITFQPWTDAPEKIYRAARVVVLPSNGEGLSNALVESLACGTPCISTDVSGAGEALGVRGGEMHGLGGLIVPRNDCDALATATLRVLRDDTLRAELSRGGHTHVQQVFNKQACVDLFMKGVQDVLQRRGQTP